MAATSGNVGQLAGLGSRLAAYLIDLILVSIVGGILTVPLLFFVIGGDPEAAGAVPFLGIQALLVVGIFAYFILMEGLYGYTVGKKLLSITVVDANGRQIGVGKSAIRNVLRIVDALPTLFIVGIVAILVTDDQQRVGDMVASTYVVKG